MTAETMAQLVHAEAVALTERGGMVSADWVAMPAGTHRRLRLPWPAERPPRLRSQRRAREVTDDLITFLRARADDLDRAADLIEDAGGLDQLLPAGIIDNSGATVYFTPDAYQRIAGVLDPAHLRREAEAKRRIIDYYVEMDAATPNGWDDAAVHAATAVESVLRLLALPHAAHPDYQEGWRP